MHKKKISGEIHWSDLDDAPLLDVSYFQQANVYEGKKLVRKGRPKKAETKVHVSLRLEPNVLEALRKLGAGWQGKANDILKKELLSSNQ
jgi:uncharacterized protein (DUF4415 family)